MRKIISIVLLLTTVCCTTLSVYADEISQTVSNNEVFDGVVLIGREYYLLDDNNEIAEHVGRLDLDLRNKNEIEAFLLSSNVEKEVKNYVHELCLMVDEGDLEGGIITIFSPALIVDNGTASVNSSIDYYTYNNMQMKRERVYVYNIGTGWHDVARGSTAKTVANIVSQFLLYIAGEYSKAIGLGSTLLSIFEAAAGGSVVYASANDYSQVNLKYDGVNQWVYGKLDGLNWYLGYYAQKITINQVIMEQQFVINGVGITKTSYRSPGIVCKPSSFDSPWAKAYSNLGYPIDETVSYKLYSTTFYFA